jgi:aspartokinase
LLQVLHPLAMQPAIRSQHMDVRVKNSYNRTAEGTRISKERDMSCSLVTSIVLKNSVTLVDIVSSRMLGQFGECYWLGCSLGVGRGGDRDRGGGGCQDACTPN